MKYLTSNGKIIAGDCKAELMMDLKNSTYHSSNQKLECFLEVLSLKLYLYHQEHIDKDDIGGIIDKLEDLGVLLRIE